MEIILGAAMADKALPELRRAAATEVRNAPQVTPTALMLPVLLAGTFMTFLDFFIVNVAIPSTQHSLHAGSGETLLFVAGYGLTYASGLITGSRLGDIYGRRRVFIIGMALFTLASLLCGMAPTALVLVLARMGQGVAAALLFPQVLAIIGITFSMSPPSVLACVNRASTSLEAIRHSKGFAVNLLRRSQHTVSDLFAATGDDKFATIPWQPSPGSGLPRLTSGLAFLDCRLHIEIPTTSHIILIGHVRSLACSTLDNGPLIYLNRHYGHWSPD